MESQTTYRHYWNWTTGGIHAHSPLDTLVTIFYLLVVLSIGLRGVLSHNRATIKDFFLAGQNLAWWLIGGSLFASNIGSGHFMALAGLGASSGIVAGAFDWNAILALFLLGWIFIPIYIKAEVVTVPEYLRMRFGSTRIQLFLSILFLFVYIFSRISLEICYGAMFLKMVWDIDIYQTLLVMLTVAGTYTITGGLRAVVYTEVLHTGTLILGSALLMGYVFHEVGGYQGLVQKYFSAIPSLVSSGNWTAQPKCYMPRKDAFHVFRDPVSGDVPWPGLLFGATTVSLFYGCADQVSVQRFLAGKDLCHTQGGALLCGYLKLLPMFLMVMPGMISRILFPDQVACVVPSECQKYCGGRTSCFPIAYPILVIAVLPTGLQGLMLSTVCAALMSSLTSVFNSASALFTMNIYTWLRPMATEKELLVSGRFFVVILLAVTIAWTPMMQTDHSAKLYMYMQVVKGNMVPPVTAVFLLAVFCKRVNEKGAFWGLALGIAIGVIRILAEFVYRSWTCEGNSKCPVIVCGLHHLYFSAFLLVFTLLIVLAISLITDPIPEKHLHGLCWSLRNSQEKRVALEPELRWKKFPSPPTQPDVHRESGGCFWRNWDLFCGLEPLPDPKVVPATAAEEMELSDTLEGAEVLASGEAAGKMEVTREKKEDAEWRGTLGKPFERRVVNAGAVILFLLLVASHVYYA